MECRPLTPTPTPAGVTDARRAYIDANWRATPCVWMVLLELPHRAGRRVDFRHLVDTGILKLAKRVSP